MILRQTRRTVHSGRHRELCHTLLTRTTGSLQQKQLKREHTMAAQVPVAVAIRRARTIDARTVRDLAEQTTIETWAHLYSKEDFDAYLREKFQLQRFESDLADATVGIWIAELDGEAIGLVSVGDNNLPVPKEQLDPSAGEIRKFYMLKKHQGSGIGSKLFDTAMQWLQSQGPRTVYCGVWSENYGAQRFYERKGFRKCAEYGFVVGKQVDREFIMVYRPTL